MIKENNLDVLVFVNTSGADIAARVGYPSVTVPVGYTKSNKPVGLTFTSISFTIRAESPPPLGVGWIAQA